MSQTLPPAKNPCGSCPYRCDSPSGLWSEGEYRKLPPFDTGASLGVFKCHQANGRLCAGWVATHDMREMVGLRIQVLEGRMTIEAFDAVLKYKTNVPVFASGQEAYEHGMRDIDNPDDRSRKVAAKLVATREGIHHEHRSDHE